MSKIGRFGCIENALERTGTPGNVQERTLTHGQDVIISEKGHCEFRINAQTSTHLPSDLVVADVFFFVLLLWGLFE